jgi:hypothetical protein
MKIRKASIYVPVPTFTYFIFAILTKITAQIRILLSCDISLSHQKLIGPILFTKFLKTYFIFKFSGRYCNISRQFHHCCLKIRKASYYLLVPTFVYFIL